MSNVASNSNTLRKVLFDPIDGTILVLFRILWGIIMCMEVHSFIQNGFEKMFFYWYSSPKGLRFQYWIPFLENPIVYLPDPSYMKIFLVFMLIMGIFITIGLFYKASCIIFFIGFIYMYYLDATWYLNHIYMCIVVALILCIMPCNRQFSVDVLIFPNLYSPTVPRFV